MRSLLVMIPDHLTALVAKGEIQPRYYNPGNLFDEVHILMTNNDRPDPAQLQRTVGSAKLFLYNLPEDYTMHSRRWSWGGAYLLKRWAQPAVDLAKQIRPNLIRCHGADMNAYSAMRIRSKLGIPYVVSLHINPDVNMTRRFLESHLSDEQKQINRLFEYVERKSLRCADLVMPVYKPIIPYLNRIGVKRYQVCYNVLSGEDIRCKQDYQIHAPARIISVGRLFEDKNPSNIILALRDLDNVELTIVGDGPLRETHQELTATLRLTDRVIFRPAVPNTELCRELPNYDIFTIHSEFWEINKSLLEALLTGLPSVVNLRQGPPVPELEGDFLLKVEDSREGCRTAFEKLLSDHDFRQALGSDAFRHAQEQWSPEKTEAAYVDVYRRYSKI